ncbi:hypothetical protein MRB53_012795 [Persea americana]|uniref:Uncharacterized protein n=1 Tax=Persea americana TaxID=3435 RepID=A0ACC2LYR9_PERAE|nr:hypothetical protein MRB53_012795 [Persea americana]
MTISIILNWVALIRIVKRGGAVFNFGFVYEVKEDPSELLSIARFMYLCLNEQWIARNKLPQRKVLPRHHIVPISQLQIWTVVTLSIANVDESLLTILENRGSESLDDRTLNTIEEEKKLTNIQW